MAFSSPYQLTHITTLIFGTQTVNFPVLGHSKHLMPRSKGISGGALTYSEERGRKPDFWVQLEYFSAVNQAMR